MIEYLGSPYAVLFFVAIPLLLQDAVPVVWLLAGWDVYTGTWLVFTWAFIVHMTPDRIRRWANKRPASTPVLGRIRRVHLLTTVSITVLSLFGLVFAFVLFSLASEGGTRQNLLAFALSGVAIVLSWLALNTAFTLHYTSLYYRDRIGASGDGFGFSGNQTPTLLDFAYLAFTVGTTFETSDVDVTSRRVRVRVLIHTLLSFWYTTGILAFVVNFAVSYG